MRDQGQLLFEENSPFVEHPPALDAMVKVKVKVNIG